MVRADQGLQFGSALPSKKANVVADALSRKSHCNTLEALLEDGFNLLHPIVLHNITISCSLESEIIELQKTYVGIFHIKRKMQEQETKHSG